jgi:hypothetical protein
MLSEAEILTALSDCCDPYAELNLTDLWLIDGTATGPGPKSTPHRISKADRDPGIQ